MKAKKIATAKRRHRASRVLPLNVHEHSGITWIWTSDPIYQLHWRNAGRTPIVRIFSDHRGGLIVLVERSRKQKKKFRGKNSEKRAFDFGTALVQSAVMRG